MPRTWAEAGRLLGERYELVEPAGSGGMAVVWRAVDTVLHREVAVKLLRATGDEARAGFAEQLKAEARAVARLKHPHITAVYDFGQHTGADGEMCAYVVMELVEGFCLGERLALGEPLAWRETVRIAAQVASALECAHRNGIVHRDVSVANIMLTDEGVKVLDFGIAALLGQPESAPEDGLLGTPAYMAPERLRSAGDPVTPATDVYALGIVWYQMLTGTMPWNASTTTKLLQAHLVYAPAPLPSVPGMPAHLAELCMSCLDKNPAARPTSRDLALTLSPYAFAITQPISPPDLPSAITDAPSAITVTVPSSPQRGRKVMLAAGAGLAMAVMTLAGATAQSWWPATNRVQLTIPTRSPQAGPAERTLPSPAASAATAAAPSLVAKGAAASAASAAPSSAPSEPAPSSSPPNPSGYAITAQGGTVNVTCAGTIAEIVSVSPAGGFAVKSYNPGPAPEVQAVLASDTHQSDIKVRCPNGIAAARVKETPL